MRSSILTSARSLSALASRLRLGLRLRGSADDQLSQGDVERVFEIGTIETVIAIAPADDETSRFEFGQFILNGLEREAAQASEFANVQFGPRIGEKQTKDFRAHLREQAVQKRLPHRPLSTRPLKRSRLNEPGHLCSIYRAD